MKKIKQNDNRTAYQAIADDLRGRIESGEFADGRLPSERKLAESYAVNRITLRKALRILFDERLIVKLGQKGTHVAEGDVRMEKMENRRVAFFLCRCDLTNSYHGAILDHAQRALRDLNASLMLYCVESVEDIEAIKKENERQKEFDGIIVSGEATRAMLRMTLDIRVPMVLIGYLQTSCELEGEVDQVVADTEHYTYDCVTRLLRKGHSRIAFVDGPAYQWSQKAQMGYMNALADAGIDYDETLVYRVRNARESSGVELVVDVLDSGATAAFIRDEKLSRGFYDGLMLRDGKNDVEIAYASHPDDSASHLDLLRVVVDPQVLSAKALELLINRLSYPYAPVEKYWVDYKIRG